MGIRDDGFLASGGTWEGNHMMGEKKTKWPELVLLTGEKRHHQAHIYSLLCRFKCWERKTAGQSLELKLLWRGDSKKCRNHKRDCRKPQKWNSSSFQQGCIGVFSCSLCLYWNSLMLSDTEELLSPNFSVYSQDHNYPEWTLVFWPKLESFSFFLSFFLFEAQWSLIWIAPWVWWGEINC